MVDVKFPYVEEQKVPLRSSAALGASRPESYSVPPGDLSCAGSVRLATLTSGAA
jgi:hypothetical protein